MFLLLQPLRWHCAESSIHHEQNVHEEQHLKHVPQTTSNNRVIPMEWSWWVTSNNACEPDEQLIVVANGDDESDLVRWTLVACCHKAKLCAHAARVFRLLPSLQHSCRVLLTRYRRWSNKVLNLKIHRWFCSHCLKNIYVIFTNTHYFGWWYS